MIELPISTGLGAVRILGYGLSWLARWWQRPFIVVSANASDPFIKATPVSVDGLDPVRAVSDARAVYYRLLVENRGGRGAHACRLQIVAVLFVEARPSDRQRTPRAKCPADRDGMFVLEVRDLTSRPASMSLRGASSVVSGCGHQNTAKADSRST